MSLADKMPTGNTSFLQGHQLVGMLQGGNYYFYVSDGLSSVRVLVDSTGTEAASASYNEFGAPENVSDPGGLMAHGYVGAAGVRNETATTGLLYMRQRWYDPGIGKWLSKDPIGFAGGLNTSNYVSQSPVNFSDPSGLNPLIGYLILVGISLASEAWGHATGQTEANRMWAMANDKVKVNGKMVSLGGVVEDTPQALRIAVLVLGLVGSARSFLKGGSTCPVPYRGNVANGPRLKQSFLTEEAGSIYGSNGNLNIEAIMDSGMIERLGPGKLNNSNIPKNFGKFETRTVQSPSGDYKVHFYMDPKATIEDLKILDLDYKVVFNARSGAGK